MRFVNSASRPRGARGSKVSEVIRRRRKGTRREGKIVDGSEEDRESWGLPLVTQLLKTVKVI